MPELDGIDSDVVHRAKKGDTIALTRLLYHTSQMLKNCLAGRVPREFASVLSPEDVLQETCLRAQQQINTLQSDCPHAFAAWLRRIAENLLQSEIRTLRTKKRGGDRTKMSEGNDGGMIVTSIPDNELTPGQALELDEIIVMVRTNLDDLPTTQRKAVKLHHIDGLTLDETAKELGKTTGVVRGLLARATRAMRSAMGTSSKWFHKK